MAINLIKTNVASLVRQKLVEEVIHPELWVERGYVATWDGRPKLTVGIGGIVYNVRVGRVPRGERDHGPRAGVRAHHIQPPG